MEEFSEAELLAMLAEGDAEVKAVAVVKVAEEKKTESEKCRPDKHIAYLQLPREVIFTIINNVKVKEGEKEVPNPDYIDGTVGDKFSAVKDLPEACKKLPIKWTVKRIMGGWNNGNGCTNISDLNRRVAYDSQMEVIPFAYNKDVCTHYYLKKCRYDAVPYVPGMEYSPLARLMFKDKTGFQPREAPANLLLACEQKKVSWVPGAFAKKFKPIIDKTFVAPVPNAASAFFALQPNTLAVVKNLVAKMDISFFADIPPVVPVTTDKRQIPSILAGSVNADWASFFSAFSYDKFGNVNVSRGICCITHVDAYVGILDDVAIWCPKRTIIKTPNKIASIIKHQHISYEDINVWPERGLVYNFEQVNLNLAMRKMTITHLVYPLHAVLSNVNCVSSFCKTKDRVFVYVLFTDPAVCVFQPTDKVAGSLIGSSIKKQLPSIEKGFVKGFLMRMQECCKEDCLPAYGFAVGPDEGYSAIKCAVKITPLYGSFPSTSHRYVSMKKQEKARMIPTAMVSDVLVDGKRLFKDPKPEERYANYPRGTPYKASLYSQPLALGMCFAKESGLIDLDVTAAMKDQDVTTYMTDREEIVKPLVDEVDPVGIFGDMRD